MSILGPITPEGAFINILIGVSAPRAKLLREKKLIVPGRVKARALVDTGASGTMIDEEIVKAPGIPPSGAARAHTPSTRDKPIEILTYDVELTLDMWEFGDGKSVQRHFSAIPVVTTDFSKQKGNVEALLGRDILSEAILIFNGYEQRFSLSF